MEAELAKMRQRLQSLQKQFTEQQARPSPWKERRERYQVGGRVEEVGVALLGAGGPSTDQSKAPADAAAAVMPMDVGVRDPSPSTVPPSEDFILGMASTSGTATGMELCAGLPPPPAWPQSEAPSPFFDCLSPPSGQPVVPLSVSAVIQVNLACHIALLMRERQCAGLVL